MSKSLVYEEGDHLYLVAPVSPITPSVEEVAAYQYAADLTKQAPNPHLAWFAGHYVEADTPNGNGAMWLSSELAIKSLTPMFMPVTVMHDPRTAVGVIADLRLRTPEADQVPRSKIETALALWSHRFPETVEEARVNYEQGSLMQSMECLAPNYDCGTCGMSYTKLPGGAERANWCAHLNGPGGAQATRILRNVVFTGTGLIFGTRGATGADPSAHLETFQQEVAEFHQRVHRDTARPRRKRIMPMDTREIPVTEYDELRARPTQAQLDEVTARAEKAEGDLEKSEIAKKKAEDEKAELETKVQAGEEAARQVTLRDERLKELGDGFKAALPESVRGRLTEQAAKLQDGDWTARLEELEELTGKKRADTDGKAASNGGQTFTRDEVASFQGGAGQSNPSEPTPGQRRSVVGGLFAARK